MISIKKIRLPNKPLNNLELEDAVKKLKIPSFRGVFLLDTLPKKPNKKECGIVNFNKSGDLGTHWVAWYKTVKIKSTAIVTVCNRSYSVPRKADTFNQRGKYFADICVYTFSKNLTQVMNFKTF